MGKKWNLLVGIIGLLAVLGSPVWAEPTITIEDIQFGDLIMGESVTHEGLKEHVVAIAYTGIN